MSSFRKYNPTLAHGKYGTKKQLAGTKAWLFGQSLISTGCGDLDNACGSGLPVGSILVVSEELEINQANTLKKYFIAEGINSKQRVLIISSHSNSSIKMDMSKIPAIRKASIPVTINKPNVNTEKGKQLPRAAAWQYSQYLSQTKGQTEIIPFCHSFDLSENEQNESVISAITCLSLYGSDASNSQTILSKVLTAISEFSRQCQANEVIGRVVLDVSSLLADDEVLQRQLYMRIRLLIRNSNLVVFSTLYPDLNGKTILKYSDCVILLQPWKGVTPPEEFSDTVGLLHVIRLPSLLSLHTPNKAIYIYGIKRSMHSLRLSELRIPPLGCKDYSGCDDLF